MKKINLRNYYSLVYPEDTFIDVPDNIADLLSLLDREEHAYYERRRANKAYYSLDADSHIEQQIVVVVLTPQDLYDYKFERDALYSAILSLPEKQRKRIYAHFFMGMGITKIARIENVKENAIRDSINRALRRMRKFIKNFSESPAKSANKSAE